MPTTILTLESDADHATLITEHLSTRGYEALNFSDDERALTYVERHGAPRLALVALERANAHHFTFCRRLKSVADVPLIFLVKKVEPRLLLEGLQKYGEDFVVKPINWSELDTRIQNVLRSMPDWVYARDLEIRVDEKLRIDFRHHRIHVGDQSHRLTPIEAQLLRLLIANATRVVENPRLLARVWPTEDVDEDTLRVHMHRLRRKLERDAHNPRYIRTERGIGYVFTVRPREEASAG